MPSKMLHASLFSLWVVAFHSTNAQFQNPSFQWPQQQEQQQWPANNFRNEQQVPSTDSGNNVNWNFPAVGTDEDNLGNVDPEQTVRDDGTEQDFADATLPMSGSVGSMSDLMSDDMSGSANDMAMPTVTVLIPDDLMVSGAGSDLVSVDRVDNEDEKSAGTEEGDGAAVMGASLVVVGAVVLVLM